MHDSFWANIRIISGYIVDGTKTQIYTYVLIS